MAAISGKDGYVVSGATTLAQITGWRFTRTSNNPAWASNSTGGYKSRVAGVKDGSGSFDFKYDSVATGVDTVLDEGDTVTLVLYLDATQTITVPAVIDSLSTEVDINDGEVVGGTADFSITAAWTKNL